MRVETLLESSKSIVDSIRDEIRQGNTNRESKTASGWRYGGEQFVILVDSLKSEIEKELQQHGLQVLACAVRHFNRMEKINNPLYPTKRLIIIPVNGVSTIPPGDLLPIDTYCFIDGLPRLSGEDIDVVVVAYEVKTQNA